MGEIVLIKKRNNEKYTSKGERGIYNSENRLNELTGKEWIKFTKSWFIHNPPPRKGKEWLHPAKFPETIIHEFIEFFTKSGQWVLDPFLGTGSTLVACQSCNRNGIGIEIMKKYADISKKRLQQSRLTFKSEQIVIKGDSLNIIEIWKEKKYPLMDFCITSPPYWNQLKRNNIRQEERKRMGLDTKYGEEKRDIGNIDDYDQFLEEQRRIFENVWGVMKDGAYLVVITNNVYADGRLYPLAFDSVRSLSKNWVPKDEKIWLQDNKALIPLGVNNAWVGNRHHQYCLIFRKEVKRHNHE